MVSAVSIFVAWVFPLLVLAFPVSPQAAQDVNARVVVVNGIAVTIPRGVLYFDNYNPLNNTHSLLLKIPLDKIDVPTIPKTNKKGEILFYSLMFDSHKVGEESFERYSLNTRNKTAQHVSGFEVYRLGGDATRLYVDYSRGEPFYFVFWFNGPPTDDPVDLCIVRRPVRTAADHDEGNLSLEYRFSRKDVQRVRDIDDVVMAFVEGIISK